MDTQIPPELVELVIKNIDPTDKSTLGKCGLVSRTWLALSRPILFSCVRIDMKHEKLLNNLGHATFPPFVREVNLWPDVIDEPWMKKRMPKIIPQLTALNTLRLHHVNPHYPERLLPEFSALKQLELVFDRPPAGGFGLPAFLRLACAFPVLERFKISTESEYNHIGPFILPDRAALGSLAHLHTLDLDYPMVNAQIIAYIIGFTPPPPLTMLNLVLRSDSDRLHECLRAAGPALRTLALSFPALVPRDLRVGRLTTPPLATGLRSLRVRSPHREIFAIAAHLLSLVLRAANFEELVIEIEVGPAPLDGVFVALPDEVPVGDLERVLDALPTFKTMRIYAPAEWRQRIPASLLRRASGFIMI
ncbi:hypothetical protein C8R44DRAFT_885300 [Mycena epipterygia]|nr:hypothetical protein C8R44DRAFT_885300 [Mycena epipterygia]